jgi:phosphopantetheine--protein transferase-like protein
MVGDMNHEKLASYLQRLTGNPVDQHSLLRLSSAQRAALTSWLRREGIPYAAAALSLPAFTISDLLEPGGEIVPKPAANRTPPAASRSRSLVSRLRVGIDMEQTSSLPDALDYREHEFYRDNFTPAEIAYCLQRSDAKNSLCGLWAAKEAIIKALGDDAGEPRTLEIGHDASGKPTCLLGELSISHSGDFCIAVFVAMA